MLGNRRLQAKTIKGYIINVRSAHVDMGYEVLDMFHSSQLERIVAGIRRLLGEADARSERKPITKDILLRLLTQFNRSILHGATIQAFFCLVFAAFLRVGEFTYTEKDLEDDNFDRWFLTQKSVKLYRDRLELTLPASMTDPFNKALHCMLRPSMAQRVPFEHLGIYFRSSRPIEMLRCFRTFHILPSQGI